MKPAAGLHVERQTRTAREAFVECRSESEAVERQREIDALPVAEWKGKQLRTLRCNGTTGKGPHNTNVPESLLWALIDLRRWFCPYHSPRFDEAQDGATSNG